MGALMTRASSGAQGAQLEPDLGSGRFLALVAELLTLSHLATVGLAAGAARLAPDVGGAQYHASCAIGFSAVLFALKVVLSYRTPGWSSVCGISLPTKVCPLLPHPNVQLVHGPGDPFGLVPKESAMDAGAFQHPGC